METCGINNLLIMAKGKKQKQEAMPEVPAADVYVALNGVLYPVKGYSSTTAWLKDGVLSMEQTEGAEPVPIQLVNFEA